MIVMRDADLWDELNKNLSCKRIGEAINIALALCGHGSDVAQSIVDEQNTAERDGLDDWDEEAKSRKRNFIRARMVASQALLSEFVVTGCFLTINGMCYLMNQNGFVAYQQLIPLQVGVAASCINPCICDGDGVVSHNVMSLPQAHPLSLSCLYSHTRH